VAIQNATRGKSQNGIGVSTDDTMYTLDQGSQHAVAISGRARGDDGRGYARPEHVSVDVASTLDGVKQDRVLAPGTMAVRRLTPLECERLMDWPDNWTLVPYRKGMMADGPRYKMCGNGMVSACMRWIGARMEMVDRIP
jgi:DNA (cytosine-5)-methyltransferase 1